MKPCYTFQIAGCSGEVNITTSTTNAVPTTSLSDHTTTAPTASSAISDPTTTESVDGMLNYKHNIEGLVYFEDYILWETPS